MKITVLLLLLLWRGAAPALRAQCLKLSDLLTIGADPVSVTSPPAVTSRLGAEWSFKEATAASREAYWAWAGPEAGALAPARLTVRPQRPGQDVVLKTTQGSCLRELRSELKSRKLVAQPVTCPGCEAVRFQGPDFEATLYSQMKGDYPFVMVVHQVPAAGPATGSTTGLPPVPVVDRATAIKLLADPQAKVLDVRTPEEFAAGHLLGAQNLNFRAANFSELISKLDPKARYVLYCATGNRSGQAAALMQQRGLPNVTNAGGYLTLKEGGAK